MTQDTSTRNSEINPSRRRRLLYGSNLGLLALITTMLVVFLNYAAQYRSSDGKIHPLRWDMSASGVNSLAPHTLRLLNDLDARAAEKNDVYELATNFGEGEQGRLVHDLLSEYARRSTHVKLYPLDEGGLEKLEQKIAEKFADERVPYEAVLKDFDKTDGLADELTKFLQIQGVGLGQLLQTSKDPDLMAMAGPVQVYFSKEGPEDIADLQKELRKMTDSTMPDWSTVKKGIASLLDRSRKNLGLLGEPGKIKDQLPKPMFDYLTAASPAFKKILASISAFQDRLNSLQPLKMDQVRNDLQSPDRYVLVFGPASVRVIPSSDLFKNQPNESNPRQAGYSFEGEQAVSSVLLGMVRPVKPKVVFIGEGQNAAQFSAVRDWLTKYNFEVLEWSPPSPQQMNPDAPPPPAQPPAIGKGVVWVVFPIDSSPQMMMMGGPPDNSQLVALVKHHLDGGGSALFLAEAASPMPFGGADSTAYPYNELLKPYGIEVQSQYTAVQLMQEGNEPSVAMPQIRLTHFPKHDITNPLRSQPTLFTGVPTRFGISGSPTVVQIDAKANASACVIVQTDRLPELFATKSYSQDVHFDPTTDLASPVPLGAAAIKSGDKDASRVVVLGNRIFARNDLIEAQPAVVQRENALVRTMIKRFPGNGELFANSVYWLAGYEHMISLSSQANGPERIDISDQTLARVRWLLILFGLPLAALTIGGAVLIRRRR